MEKEKRYTQEELNKILKREKWLKKELMFSGAVYGYIFGILVCNINSVFCTLL